MNPRVSASWERLKAHRLASVLLTLVILALGILIGTVVSNGVHASQRAMSASDATPLTIPPPQQLSTAFAQIAKQLEPAVVNINTESTVRNPHAGRRMTPPGGGDDQQDNPFQDFFDKLFPQMPGGQGGDQGTVRERSLGSGVLVDPKGYILTNRHVVNGASRIRVRLMDDAPGSTGHDAKVVGSDLETDVAVIKIDTDKPLPVAKLGNSDGMQVGDWVLAIGSPFGLRESVTAGIVSAKGRGNTDIPGLRQFQSFIQTDAAINPGNSGGPLVNMAGEVIGINTAIYTEGQGYEGVGFAMPSNAVAKVYNALIGPEHRVIRGSIGVVFNAEPNPAVSKVYGPGVTISDVEPNGPADKAGIKPGDTIVAVDGKPMKDGDELVDDIVNRKPGSTARIDYIHDGQKKSVTVTIADRSKLLARTLGEEEQEGPEGQPAPSKMGITVRNLTPDLADRLSIPPGKGVVVQDVKPGSFADDIGVSRGMVILQINKQPVNSDTDFRRIESQLKPGENVAMMVRLPGPNGQNTFLGGTLPSSSQ
jgi:serine protease Do